MGGRVGGTDIVVVGASDGPHEITDIQGVQQGEQIDGTGGRPGDMRTLRRQSGDEDDGGAGGGPAPRGREVIRDEDGGAGTPFA